jgi:hypothetical protein
LYRTQGFFAGNLLISPVGEFVGNYRIHVRFGNCAAASRVSRPPRSSEPLGSVGARMIATLLTYAALRRCIFSPQQMHTRPQTVGFLVNAYVYSQAGRLRLWQSLISREGTAPLSLSDLSVSAGVAELLDSKRDAREFCIILYAVLKVGFFLEPGAGVVECARIWL